MIKNKNRLDKILLLNMMLLPLISMIILTYLWLYYEQKRFEDESLTLRTEYIKFQKSVLKNEVERAIDYVRYENSLAEKRLETSIRERIYEAHGIAMNIYMKNKDKENHDTIKQMIKETLRSIRFNHGRGYYFIIRLDGTSELIADRPELEGTNMSDARDTDGKYMVRKLIEIVKESNEGFYQYRWSKPKKQGMGFLKIAFVKHFEPFEWFIGTGEYLDDVEADIQAEVLDRLVRIRFGKDGYVFGSTYDGDPLFTNGKITRNTKNIWELTDPKGIRIIQEQRRIVENPEGGFLYYSWKKLTQPQPSPKVSFVKGIPEWRWMIGSGAYLDEIETVILEKKNALTQRIRSYMIRILLILLILLILIFLIAKYMSYKIRASIDVFSEFFQTAATKFVRIESELLHFKEFETLAHSANQMIAARNQAEEARKQAESELWKMKNYLDNIVNSMPSVLVGVSAETKVTHWNLNAEKTTGLSAEEALGEPLEKVFPLLTDQLEKIRQSIREGTLRKTDRMACQIKGENCHIEVMIYPLIVDGAEGAVVRVDDVTSRVRLEEVMIQTEKMMSVGGLAAGMAHEINNPLAGIIQSVQNVTRRVSPELPANEKTAKECGTDLKAIRLYMEQRGILNMLEGIRQSGKKAAEIVENMLRFSRRSESRMMPVNLANILERTIELASHDYDLKKKYDFRNIEIMREYEPDMPEVPCSETEIEQVILNLLRNAAQAMGSAKNLQSFGNLEGLSPQIILRLKQDGNMARIEVGDNGVGMDEKTRKRVFEPFFTTKEVGTGTGLGLSVSYFIITTNHNGTMTVESEPGKGSRFIIWLPYSVTSNQ